MKGLVTRNFIGLCALLLFAISAGSAGVQEAGPKTPWPGGEWSKAAPEEVGLSRARVDAYLSWLTSKAGGEPFGTVIVRYGRIAIEHYGSGATSASAWEIGSIRKAVGSSLLGMTIEEGKLKLDTPAHQLWPEILNAGSEDKDRSILVRHLFESTSGWKRPEAPGTKWVYNNAAFTAGQVLLGRVYRLPDDQIAPLAKSRIADPIGASSWHCYHYPNKFSDSYGNPGPKLAVDSTLPDLARFGHLWLHGGEWDGKQIIPKDYVREATRNQVAAAGGHYGFCWFVNDAQKLLPNAPDDTFFHVGNGKDNRRTVLAVIPSLDLVATVGTNAEKFDITSGYKSEPVPHVNEWIGKVLACVQQTQSGERRTSQNANAKAPYPTSPVIRDITWHADSLQSAAPGSDLWPVTWGPDDQIYASWGDGGGFGGTNSDGRVAMGFARIEGPPEKFVAVNVNGGKNALHPASFPDKGKTGGIVFVDGVLYAWLNRQDGPWPNVNQALIWSEDRGATWKEASWQWPKGEGNFKANTFLQFGKDYAGARDDYVYFYGRNETPSAKGTNGYMGRVQRTKLQSRDAYEFFAGLDAEGKPTWSPDVNERKPHFTDPNCVEGIQVVYDPGIKRYLLTAHRGDQGTLGVFDAPEPWGPWTTVGYYDNWLELKGTGIKRQMLYINIATKWIPDDGKTLWVIFTGGQDRFKLVKATLRLR